MVLRMHPVIDRRVAQLDVAPVAWARSRKLDLTCAALATVLPVVVAVLTLQLWSMPDPRTSIAIGNDAPPLLAMIKGINASGWYLTNPALGAPFGQELYDFPVYAGDSLHMLVIKVLSLFADQPGLILNAFALMSFAWCGTAAYLVMRALDVSAPASVVPAVLFAVLPFHFLRVTSGHTFLASYVAVPLGVYLCVATLTGRPLVATRRRGSPRLRWASARTMATLGLCVVIGTTGIYFALLSLALLAVATLLAAWRRRRAGTSLAGSGMAMVAIVVVLAVGLAPTVLYRHSHGADQAIAKRGVTDSEVYGLTLAQLVLPPGYHRIGALTGPQHKYAAGTIVRGEGTSWPGTLALAGLALLVLAALARLAGDAPLGLLGDERLSASAVLAAAAFLIGTVGGGSAVVAAVLTTQLRGWNRISVFLAFLGLLAVGIAIDRLRRRKSLAHPAVLGGMLAALLVLGALDQTSPRFRPAYAPLQANWAADGRFVHQVEQRLGGKGAVMQIPYMPFPESHGVLRMRDYDPMVGYLHAQAPLRWSYGAIRGRPADWQAALATQPLPLQVRAATAAGFDGLWVDGFGFPDAPATLAALQKLTGSSPITAESGRYSFFDLRPGAARLRRELGPERFRALGQATLHPAQPQ